MRIHSLPGRLTRVAIGNIGKPVLSGDGSTVVYNQFEDSQWEVKRFRDGHTENLSSDPRHDLEPAVSADGETVVWSRFTTEDFADPNGCWDIWRWRDGRAEPLATSPGHDTEPAISGDGRTVVFTHDDPKFPTGFNLRMWRDGQVSSLTEGPQVDREAFLNHDGSRIFWTRKWAGSEIFMQDEAGSQKPLTHSTNPEFHPATNRDGTRLLWSEEPRGDHDLYTYSTENNQRTVVAGERRVIETEGDLSADGQTLVFTRKRPGQPSHVVLRDHGQELELPFDYARLPQVSDDGRVLAWWGVEDNQAVIYRWERDAGL